MKKEEVHGLHGFFLTLCPLCPLWLCGYFFYFFDCPLPFAVAHLRLSLILSATNLKQRL
jgi:hypothetical protein